MAAASAPTHTLREFFKPVLHTIFFPSHWLLSHILTIVKTLDSGERGMNPVVMTIINTWEEYWPSQGSHHQPPVLKSCALRTELWGSAKHCGKGRNVYNHYCLLFPFFLPFSIEIPVFRYFDFVCKL